MASIGHPVVGDTLYGAPQRIVAPAVQKSARGASSAPAPEKVEALTLERNFLHAARLRFNHPQTQKPLALEAPLAPELTAFLDTLKS